MPRWGYTEYREPGRPLNTVEKIKSGYKQTSVVINDFGLTQKTRTSPTGKTTSRMTVSIRSTPFEVITDPKELGRPVATAMAEVLSEKMMNISAPASAGTVLKRKYAADALARGETWATKRYAGGRIGKMAPTGSGRLFNDSGRFARSIVANIGKQGEWIINVAVNRLDPSTFRTGVVGIDAMYRRLVALVPEFGQPAKLLEDKRVRDARDKAVEYMLNRNAQLRERLAKARAGVVTNLATTLLRL